ncbi:MAG: GIY-YIG nuclease family protein [Cyclobacteriaceae bacterium]|nr:GIY-YIG nuclease family protein [Cyclobacteriaceae bacterium]MBX2957602.1 GIY-YIG nuclease family protein [Cyclobacteriaceae bacterium]
MFFVYALKSVSRNYIYVGLTSDLQSRIDRHNKGYERTTRPYTPFQLILSEEFPDRASARGREKFLKSGQGKDYLKSL